MKAVLTLLTNYTLAQLLTEHHKSCVHASTEGGVEIETVAEETPELIHKAEIDPLVGPQAYQARELGLN